MPDVSVSVMDINGKLISTEKLVVDSGFNRYELNTANLESGIYVIQLTAGANTVTQKLIKQ